MKQDLRRKVAVDHELDHADGDDEGLCMRDLPAVMMDLPAADPTDAQNAGEDLEYSKTLPVGGKHSKDLENEFQANFPDFEQASASAGSDTGQQVGHLSQRGQRELEEFLDEDKRE